MINPLADFPALLPLPSGVLSPVLGFLTLLQKFILTRDVLRCPFQVRERIATNANPPERTRVNASVRGCRQKLLGSSVIVLQLQSRMGKVCVEFKGVGETLVLPGVEQST